VVAVSLPNNRWTPIHVLSRYSIRVAVPHLPGKWWFGCGATYSVRGQGSRL